MGMSCKYQTDRFMNHISYGILATNGETEWKEKADVQYTPFYALNRICCLGMKT